MRKYAFIFSVLLISCGDSGDGQDDGPNDGADDLNAFLMDNVILPSGAQRLQSDEVTFGSDNLLAEVDLNNAFDVKLLASGGAVVSLELQAENEDITHVGLQFDGEDDVWIIPINDNPDLAENRIEYSIDRPAMLCSDFDQNCVVTTAKQYAAIEGSSGEFTLSQAITVNVASICGDCLDPSCGGLGNVCFANVENPNPSTITWMGTTFEGGVVQCSENNLGLRDYGLGNGAFGVAVVNGAESGRFDIPFPDFLNDFSQPQRLWVSLDDGLGQNGQFGFLAVSGSVSFSGNRATIDVILEDSRTVFDPDADHSANRFAMSGVIVCTN